MASQVGRLLYERAHATRIRLESIFFSRSLLSAVIVYYSSLFREFPSSSTLGIITSSASSGDWIFSDDQFSGDLAEPKARPPGLGVQVDL